MEKAPEKKTGIDLDKILAEEIGQFGWFQLRTITLTAIAVIFTGVTSSEFVFTTARVNTRCFIPECESTENPELIPSWIFNAIPQSGSSIDGCQRFSSTVNVTSIKISATCPASLFDTSVIVDCEQFVYENNDTVVYTFGLACREWQRSFIGTARKIGTLLALPIAGYASDRWGRRTTLAVSASIRASIGLSRSWINSYVGFTLLEFLETTLGSGVFSSAYILVLELFGPRIRVAGGTAMHTLYSVGSILVSLVAATFHDWRVLTRILYGPMLFTSFSLWIVPESIRWYMSKGQYQAAEDILKNAAHLNGTCLSDHTLEALKQAVDEEQKKNALESVDKANEDYLIVQLFRHTHILIRCIILPFWWITYTFVYFGLSINAVNISGNRYLNYGAVSAMEIPGYWTSMLLLDRIGRKPVLICAFWICATCQAAYIFMPKDYYGASLAVYLIGQFAIAMVTTGVYLYTAELFPTKYRHSLLGFSSMVGRLGAIMASLTPAMADSSVQELPFVLFGSFTLVSGCLVFITPETLGTKFPDTMEEASNIRKKDASSEEVS